MLHLQSSIPLVLELPRRLQAAFSEAVQRTAATSSGEITHDTLSALFKETYGYDAHRGHCR